MIEIIMSFVSFICVFIGLLICVSYISYFICFYGAKGWYRGKDQALTPPTSDEALQDNK